jgi:hypothetical protein
MPPFLERMHAALVIGNRPRETSEPAAQKDVAVAAAWHCYLVTTRAANGTNYGAAEAIAWWRLMRELARLGVPLAVAGG